MIGALVKANVTGHIQKRPLFGALNGLHFFQVTLQCNTNPSTGKIFDSLNSWLNITPIRLRILLLEQFEAKFRAVITSGVRQARGILLWITKYNICSFQSFVWAYLVALWYVLHPLHIFWKHFSMDSDIFDKHPFQIYIWASLNCKIHWNKPSPLSAPPPLVHSFQFSWNNNKLYNSVKIITLFIISIGQTEKDIFIHKLQPHNNSIYFITCYIQKSNF